MILKRSLSAILLFCTGSVLIYGLHLRELNKAPSITMDLSLFQMAADIVSFHLKENPSRKTITSSLEKNSLQKESRPKAHGKVFQKPLFLKKDLGLSKKEGVQDRPLADIDIHPLSLKRDDIVHISHGELSAHYGFKADESSTDRLFEKSISLKEDMQNPSGPIVDENVEVRLNIVEKEQFFEISNEELVDNHHGFKVDAEESVDWLVYFKKQEIGKKLITFSDGEKKIEKKHSAIEMEKVDRIFQVNEVSKMDTQDVVDLTMASIVPVSIHKEKESGQGPSSPSPVIASVDRDSSYPTLASVNKDSLSPTVKKAIDRVYSRLQGMTQKTEESKMSPRPEKTEFNNLAVFDYSEKNKSKALEEERIPEKRVLNSRRVFNGENFIPMDARLYVYDAYGGDKVLNWEFIPHYDPNSSFYDHGDGKIKIERKLNSQMAVLSGTINAAHMMRTTINWMVTLEDQIMELPLLSRQLFYGFLEKYSLRDSGAHLLVKLGDEVDEVELDGEYIKKIYLNESFKEEGASRYILYVGVSPGNRLIRYLTFKDQVAEKVVFLNEENVLYDDARFLAPHMEKIILKEKKPMGNDLSELVIDGKQIRYFNTKINASILAPGLYEYKRPGLPTGMRQYLRLSHLDGVVFAGHWDKETLEVPSTGFIDMVYHIFDLEELYGRCFIQLNLSKDILQIKKQGMNAKGFMDLKMMMLEIDGTVTDEITNSTEKIFLLGEGPGIVNMEISYGDGLVDILQTYCSSDSYLIEQL